jgi:anti-sigma regulatory factor (Ser/Thr protein kinase)
MTSFRIREPLDVYAPRHAVVVLGAQLGFTSTGRAELAIVVSELCSNIVKYGICGSIEFGAVNDPMCGVGMLIIARDMGPPFRNRAMALQDGCDDRGPIDPGELLRRGGLGIGLGAVVRLTHSLEVLPEPEGKRIQVVKYLVPPRGARSF